MKNLLCKIGIHKYESVEITDCFTTSYQGKAWKSKHVIWYQVCSCCNRRRLKDNYRKEILYGSVYSKHSGIEYARLGWERYGKMYLGPGNVTTHNTPKPSSKPKLRVLDGGKNE